MPRAGRGLLRASFAILVCAAAFSVSRVASAQPAADLEAEFRELVELLPGRYSGEIADPTDPAGQRRTPLHHKIVRIELPAFGEYVFHHQISRDALDSPQPWQQKLYVFDRDRGRKLNTMRSFIIPNGVGLANFEADPVRLGRLAVMASPVAAGFQGFPSGCEIRWSRESAGTYVARVRRPDCSYDSPAFKQRISPELTYRVTRDAFGIEDVLYGADGKSLFPASGLLVVRRLPSGMAGVLAASTPAEWRRPDPERTLYMDLGGGRVVFELAPTFAPRHVANLRALSRSGWFDGLSINRVQDNFVTQWGDADGKKPIVGAASRLPPEFERDWAPELGFVRLPDGDVFASEAGFVDGFHVAGDRSTSRIWMAHCYGTLGVGRDTATDSGSGAELYVVIGHAPRQLDRNITVLGRVLSGMELLAALPRGTDALGFYATAAERTPIRSMRFAADLPAAQRTALEILRTDSPSFAALVEARRNRRDDFYKVPAGKIDLCSVPLPVRRVAP
jgi:peptidylprolyl isomerase